MPETKATTSALFPIPPGAYQPTVTSVRTALLDYHGHLDGQMQPYLKEIVARINAKDDEPVSARYRASLDAYQGLLGASLFTFVIAAMLRRVETKHGADAALDLARFVDTAMASGMDWIGDANNDLIGDNDA